MFNWLQGRPKSNLPEPTALQTQRAKQIDQLKTFNQNVSEIQRDVEYRVNTLLNGSTFSLYITLPPQFPQDKPMVRVSPAVNHPWINSQNLVSGCPGLNNFVVHSDLGKVIRELIEEFQRNPPIMNQSYGVPGYPTPSLGLQAGYNPMSIGGQMPNYMPQVPMPTLPPSSTVAMQPAHIGAPYTATPVPALSSHSSLNRNPSTVIHGSAIPPGVPLSFPQLKDLSYNELKALQENEDQLDQFINDIGIIQSFENEKESLIVQNEQLARDNLLMKPNLEDRKRHLLEKYDQLNELRGKFDESSQKQDELRHVYDPQVVRNNLQVAAMQAEEEAEGIAEKFLEGDMTIDEFQKRYMTVRSLSYLRKAKEEKYTTALVQNRLL